MSLMWNIMSYDWGAAISVSLIQIHLFTVDRKKVIFYI